MCSCVERDVNQGYTLLDIELVNAAKHVLKVACKACALVTSSMLLSPLYLQLPSATTALPEKICQISKNYLAYPLIYCREKCMAALPALRVTFSHGLKQSVNVTTLLCGSALEEIVFRGIIQTALLTELPKAVLRRIAPQYEPMVDHTIAKTARVVTTSALFALSHIVRLGNHPGMLAAQFIAGIFFGTLCERDHSLANLSAIHFFTNVLLVSISGGIYTGAGVH